MEIYSSKKEYTDALVSRALLPSGFRVSVSPLSFFPTEIGGKKQFQMNLSLILLERPTDSFHAVFTRNLFAGAPVIIGRRRLKEKLCRGVLINNKISNVACPGGIEDAESVLASLAGALNAKERHFFAASTGIIGWKLPVKEMCGQIPALVNGLTTGSLAGVAEAIMTTDAYPKARCARCGDGVITAIAKGAGMIEPNMGTMLVFILTDCAIDRAVLKDCLTRACAETLNRISIDGDQSTSDMAIALSSQEKPLADKKRFYTALRDVLQKLSDDIVRNGEGVSHVIRVRVTNASSVAMAEGAGKAIINSPLVKTAIFGNDPNVGRIVGALGDFLGNHGYAVPRENLSLAIGDTRIFEKNQFSLDEEKEKRLQQYLKENSFSLADRFPPHDRCVEIHVDVNTGKHTATVLGADLTYDYVKENADYRS